MRKIALSLVLAFVAVVALAQEKEYQVEFKTNVGSFTVKLYNETPLHRDNFLKLVRQGDFNNLVFHRVIKNFMVQAGGAMKGDDGKAMAKLEAKYPKMIPAEFHYPELYHKKGALAAARQGDEENPEKESSPIQFYIVTGQCFLENELEKYDNEKRGKMPDYIKQTYMTEGGTPHLDTEYTVFGEVLEGIKTIDKIQNSETDDSDRPTKDIYIISTKILQK